LDRQTPLFVRPLTADERATLEAGLRSSSALTVRRCQILLASAAGQRRPPWRTTCAVPTRPCAMRFMPATGVASRCCNPFRHARTPRPLSSTPGPASPSGRCGTTVHAPSASPPAGGPSSWPPKSVSPKSSRRAWSATKPSVWPSAGWACRGNAPNTGLRVPIRPMPAKKTT
jgi:hypothetical protein